MSSYLSFLTSKKPKTNIVDVNLLFEAADVLIALKHYVGLIESFENESFDIIDDTNSLFNEDDKDDDFVYLDSKDIASAFEDNNIYQIKEM